MGTRTEQGPWREIAQAIRETTGTGFELQRKRSVGGGCINEAYRIEGDGQVYFAKLHGAGDLPMFEAERAGLEALGRAQAVRVPQPLCCGSTRDYGFLVMEWIAFGRRGDTGLLGRQLARQHHSTSERFGWGRDNTIGTTPQVNTPNADWVAFWRAHRLGFQLELARRKGYGGRLQQQGERLMAQCAALFTDHRPTPSLLHGDLWGGNWAPDREGRPVIFDPAVYYGDREADLAMTELFGGFAADFYHTYREAYPLDPGYGVRKTFYNLYHILNHLNLFGGGYAEQAERMISQVLAELGH
jgi:protein-ribulosamine 3-kinase